MASRTSPGTCKSRNRLIQNEFMAKCEDRAEELSILTGHIERETRPDQRKRNQTIEFH